eukprot:CAMPEP_0194350834 /NCGR_PEP_ID=MMETSP0171-20130528/107851_1 /TAXON_ID=218684 /ORGANISM="Corethron pennatum, Strain L29A3" /LENGTH=434 /DNA_ID=CAMNT_0039118413 /DNA_START=15 /DNA_END=1318 /DNA_ORIENTATION=+
MEAVYGSDVDVLSWEFGMIDSKNYWKIALWAVRAGNLPNRPVMALLDGDTKRWDIFQDMEEYGVGVFKEIKFGHHLWELPDYEEDRNPPDVPPALQHFVCNSPSVETGQCSYTKYKYANTNTIPQSIVEDEAPGVLASRLEISPAQGKLPRDVHGVNTQRMFGPAGAMPSSTMLNSESVLDSINSADDKDKQLWAKSLRNIPKVVPKTKSRGFDIAWNSLYRSNPSCSTALLPSESRFNGLVTGEKVIFANGTYDSGRIVFFAKERSEKRAAKGKNVTMELIADNRERPCSEVVERDYNDYFFVWKVDSHKVWHTKTIPNKAEYAAFAKEGQLSKENLIVACLETCVQSKCTRGMVGSGKKAVASIYVDDVQATYIESIDRCTLIMPSSLSSKKRSWTSKAGSKPGQYEIQIQMRSRESMRISSFVVIPFISDW